MHKELLEGKIISGLLMMHAVTILANLGQLCRVGGIESFLPSSPRSKEGLTQLELE